MDGRTLQLTSLECRPLDHLTAHPRRVHTRDHLVATLWGYRHIGDGRTTSPGCAASRGPPAGTRSSPCGVGYKYVS